MIKVLFSLLLLLAFFLSLESLTSDSKDIKLTDEIMWLFNERSVLEMMDLNHVKELNRRLEKAQNDLVRDSHDSTKRELALAEIANLDPALKKSLELEQAFNRMDEVDRNYANTNPELSRKTKDYLERTKRESLKLLRDFFGDDQQLEQALK